TSRIFCQTTPHHPRLTSVPYPTLFRSQVRYGQGIGPAGASGGVLQSRDELGHGETVEVHATPSSRRTTSSSLRTSCCRPVFSPQDRKSTRLNSSHVKISYAVSCVKTKT